MKEKWEGTKGGGEERMERPGGGRADWVFGSEALNQPRINWSQGQFELRVYY